MKILYVVRLFSGIEDGLQRGVWEPKGVPTICRMIEALDRGDHQVRFIFTCKDVATKWAGRTDQKFTVEGLRHAVTVLVGGNSLPRWLGRARGYLRELRQLWPIWRAHRDFKPDVMYFDRVNIYQAALAARFTDTPVVWRVMGVPPAMYRVLEAHDLVSRFTRWAYRAPFAKVICSLDGSGGKAWMDRALSPDTPRVEMLNGVDADSSAPLDPAIEVALPAKPTKVLFISRLVDDKGCTTFMEGFLGALRVAPGDLHAVIAGDGPYRESMRAAAKACGANCHVSFLGSIPHDQVIALHRHCEIYVSLNPMGNLSNSNLEAIKIGACMILPVSRPGRSVDEHDDEIIAADAALRISSPDNSEDLTEALLRLHRDPNERKKLSMAAVISGRRSIPSWRDRINSELAMLEEIAAMGKAPRLSDSHDPATSAKF